MLPDLQAYARIILRSISHRAELAGIELTEARDHLVVVLLLLAGAAALVLLAGGVVTFFVAAAFWDTAYRLQALAALFVCYAGAAAVCFFRMRQLMRDWEPFPLTKDQLRKDASCVETLMRAQSSQ